MPPVRFVVLRDPCELSTPQRTSWPLCVKPEREKVTATESFSPTSSEMGRPAGVKYAQKASDPPALVISKSTKPGWSVRTVLAWPLKSQTELLRRSCNWLFALAKVSSTTVLGVVANAQQANAGNRKR